MLEGYEAVADPIEEKKSQRFLSSQLEAVADRKFTYALLATWQIYGNQKR
jgi:callose synthase